MFFRLLNKQFISYMSKSQQFILKFSEKELSLKNTLINGQCFNWKQLENNKFHGVLFQEYMQISRLDSQTISVITYPSKIKNPQQKLYNYFNKEIQLQKLYENWQKIDKNFNQISKKLQGVRILKQQPWQCILSFICSSNNNISRITKLLQSFRQKYGQIIYQKEDSKSCQVYHTFPTLENLKDLQPEQLKDLGFGYRANFIYDSVQYIIKNGGLKWIEQLETLQYQQKKKKLIELKGVGRKVADCICLFSLNCHSAIPVDTHIFQIAKKLGYINQKQLNKKSIGDALYKKIADCYVNKFGNYAGWAQQVLFAGDLLMFKDIIEKQQKQQVEVIIQKKSRKQNKK